MRIFSGGYEPCSSKNIMNSGSGEPTQTRVEKEQTWEETQYTGRSRYPHIIGVMKLNEECGNYVVLLEVFATNWSLGQTSIFRSPAQSSAGLEPQSQIPIRTEITRSQQVNID